MTVRPQHQYTEAGTYRIRISGKCSYFTFSSIDDEYPEELAKLNKLISWGEIKAEKYDFSGAINLAGKIPSPEKNTFANYQDRSFEYLFNKCEKITTIPKDLFANIPDTITSFKGTFYECTSLSSIPAGLFDNAINVTNFDGTFEYCSTIESIPEGLFDKTKNVTTFEKTFYRCNNIDAIPLNLFDQNVNVTNFDRTFAYCSTIESIPEGLFDKTKNVTTFEKTFYRCNNIDAIPLNLFDQNVNVTNFKYTFYDLNKIQDVPKLWNRETEGVDGTGCFGSCDNLDTEKIPSPWADSEAQ